VLVAGEAANCRRVKPQSRGTTYLPVDHRRQHLALKSSEFRGFAKMKVVVQGTRGSRDPQVDREDLEHTGYDTPVLATNESKEELANPFGRFWRDRHDVGHPSPSFLIGPRIAAIAGSCRWRPGARSSTGLGVLAIQGV
jgi:hypothetical protein